MAATEAGRAAVAAIPEASAGQVAATGCMAMEAAAVVVTAEATVAVDKEGAGARHSTVHSSARSTGRGTGCGSQPDL